MTRCQGMKELKKKTHFGWWLLLLILLLLLQSCSFMAWTYYLAESLRNNNRWWFFIVLFAFNLLLVVALHFLNKRMSVGALGTAMQGFRTSRFTASFLSVAFGALLASGVIYGADRIFGEAASLHSFGGLGALLVSLAALVDFLYVFTLLHGQGISRL
jgi:hypothetical protein